MLKQFLSVTLSLFLTIGLVACGNGSATNLVSTGDEVKSNTEGATNTSLESQAQTSTSVVDHTENTSVGQVDTVIFGLDGDNEPIEWIVLDKEDNKVLLLSKYLLEEKAYNDEYVDVTWETCTCRNWLNSEYINSIFSKDEQESIITTDVINNDNIHYRTSGGGNTEDKLFLLSIEEYNKYFNKSNQSVARYKNGSSSVCWLRSPGVIQCAAAYVGNDGGSSDAGDFVSNKYGVRPALWVSINALTKTEVKETEIVETTVKSNKIEESGINIVEAAADSSASTEYTLATNWYSDEGINGTTKGFITKINIVKGDSVPDGFKFVVGEGNNNKKLNAYLSETEVTILVPQNATLYAPEDSTRLFSMIDNNNSKSFEDYTKNLSEINGLEILNTSRVKNMQGMFEFNANLKNIDVTSFNTSNVTKMNDMFRYCNLLENLDVSNFDTKNVTDMSRMFQELRSVTEIKLGEKFNTSKVEKMRAMFQTCMSIKQLDVSTFDTSNVKDMWGMFGHCNELITIYVSNKFDTKSVTNSNAMFDVSRNLIGGSGTKFNKEHIDKEYARIDSANTPGYFTLR